MNKKWLIAIIILIVVAILAFLGFAASRMVTVFHYGTPLYRPKIK